jgi:RNA polymerase sigma factor (sigma-70 family)
MVGTSEITRRHLQLSVRCFPREEAGVHLEHDERRIAFERRILAHRPAIQAFALRLARSLPNREEVALEIVQECYLRAVQYSPSFAGCDAAAWLRAIALNIYLTWRKRERSIGLTFVGLRLGMGADLAEPLWCTEYKDPEWLVITSVDGGRLFTMIRDLPTVFRKVLILREVDGLTYGEIAMIVGVPIGTVMSRLARARTALRQMWLARRMIRTEKC